ncbi:prenyltransferase/squalene oxidase repeat-containing protein [Lactococcus lactis]|uniref:prenyltransferase/squalene oxidase repeat-containing protein n=1 Tax=Lactococcus lactis TaxID=1358 RepID=UPI001F5645DE|nr:prenyltransferase/squalene oxidase repeat-containing protein [Lactococcus lactis]
MVYILKTLSDYIKNNLYDEYYGAFYSVVNRDKQDIVTEDKTLLDVSLGLLAFSKQNDKKVVLTLLKDMEQFQDKENGGFYEILDGTNIKQEIGIVKTIFIQALAQFARYVAARGLEDKILVKTSSEAIERISKQYIIKNKATILSQDWNDAIDTSIKLLDVSLLLCILNQIGRTDLSSIFIDFLKAFIDPEKGAYSKINGDGTPMFFAGKKLLDMSVMILAISALDEKERQKFASVIKDTLSFIDQHYRHPLTKGFWDKSDKDGTISVSVISAYYQKSESPFPIKSMLSHAVFLMALNKIDHSSTKSLVESMKKEVQEQILHFYDTKNGGINFGQGNWFSTPTSPTVPIARHVMVPTYTKGAFYVGNTAYLPLHEKITTLQLLGLLVLDENAKLLSPKFQKIDYQSYSFDKNKNSLPYAATTGKLTQQHIDIEKYKEWSHKTISGFSYGLTAYKSPLGVKSDKTPQNFSALHVIADMTLLGEEIPNKKQLETTLVACQNEDGGFAEQPSLLSELFTTYCVVASEFILGQVNYDVNKCLEFVRACQNEDGGFGNAPGYPSDTWHTNFGAVILHLLDAEAKDKEKLIQYLLNCQNEDGGFSVIPNGVSEVFSTFRCIDSLLVQGVAIPHEKKVIQWLQSLQDKTGGFLYRENQVVSFVGSYHAIGALYLLGSLPLEVEQAQVWLAQHQSRDGGFSRAVGAPSDTTDEGFISIHASYMLEQKVDPYWVALIT